MLSCVHSEKWKVFCEHLRIVVANEHCEKENVLSSNWYLWKIKIMNFIKRFWTEMCYCCWICIYSTAPKRSDENQMNIEWVNSIFRGGLGSHSTAVNHIKWHWFCIRPSILIFKQPIIIIAFEFYINEKAQNNIFYHIITVMETKEGTDQNIMSNTIFWS